MGKQREMAGSRQMLLSTRPVRTKFSIAFLLWKVHVLYIPFKEPRFADSEAGSIAPFHLVSIAHSKIIPT